MMKNEHLESHSATGCGRGETWTIAPARYASSKMVLRSTKDKRDGLKSEGHWLAIALGGNWTGRDGGYQLTPRRAQAWIALFGCGFSATQKFWVDDRTPYAFSRRHGHELSLADALAQCARSDWENAPVLVSICDPRFPPMKHFANLP